MYAVKEKTKKEGLVSCFSLYKNGKLVLNKTSVVLNLQTEIILGN